MTKEKRYPLPFRYEGSLVWPILFTVLFFPIAIFLCFKNLVFVRGHSSYSFAYHGSWLWIFFWAVLFFPVSIVLLCFKGADIVERVNDK